jgi:alpha-L-rhamnosidase
MQRAPVNIPNGTIAIPHSEFPLRHLLFFVLASLCLPLHAAQPWQEVTMPTVAQAADSFANPPMAYRAIFWDIWSGRQTKERLLANIEQVYTNGGGVVMINNSRRVQPKYLSPEYMDLVKFVVKECKKRGMKVWIEGDCGYPDGFAGGLISEEYPQLGMQGIVGDAHCTVAAGQTLDIPLPPDTLGIVARARPAEEPAGEVAAPEGKQFPVPADGIFKYSVPRGGAGVLTVQLPNADIRYDLTVGEPFSIKVPSDTKSISLASGFRGRSRRFEGMGGEAPSPTVVPLPADSHLKWTAPAGTGSWEVEFIRHAYRTSPTRNDNGEDGGVTKDTLYTLIDYLDPKAVDIYLNVIYGAYQKAVGDEFGKTILGFRGDETDFTGVNPWTPKLLETFQKEKGCDFKPFIPLIFGGGPLSPEAQRAKADYFDVWSGMFRDNFYKRMQAWCKARHMEFMVHLNHEELMMSRGEDLIKNEGSFWRDLRYVGVPGVDNLRQIGPGIVADFPKLAASAAHVMGHPLVWDEEGGGTGQNGKFVVDYQFVRGINYMNIRGLNRPGGGEIGWYVSRAQHLLAIGRPAAQIALLHPTDSMWMDYKPSDDDTLKIVTELLEHQIAFDHIDADELASVVKLQGGGLKNLSGQTYRAVIVPTSLVIQKDVLERLRAFAAAGGKVLFVGPTPTMVVDRTFLHAGGPPDLSFATIEPTPEITPRVLAALPPPEVKLNSPCPSIKYIHRVLKDGDVYFFFNESNETQTRTATLAATGRAQVWDAASGTIQRLAGATETTDSVTVPLTLTNYEAKFIVLDRAKQ